jgi:hypothetical protein
MERMETAVMVTREGARLELRSGAEGTPVISLLVLMRDNTTPHAEISLLVEQVLGDIAHEIIFVANGHDSSGEGTDGAGTAGLPGVEHARGDYIAVLDGDDVEQSLDTLPTLLQAADEADIVVASRYLPSGIVPALPHPYRSRAHRLAARTLFPRAGACTDPLSRRFLFKRAVVRGVTWSVESETLLLDILVRESWTRLTEVPDPHSHSATQTPPPATSPAAETIRGLRHLWDLRLTGPHGRDAVRYTALQIELGLDDPEPLDDELPDPPRIQGARARRAIWLIALAALALRLALLPIGHTWDLITAYNMFIDLAHNHSPYDSVRYLTDVARSAHWNTSYEGYAYPPVPLYIYYPLAHVFALLHPHAGYFFPASGTTAVPNLSWDFYALYKLPMWIADVLIATLLARMTGYIRGARDYLLNPYVLLVSAAWTFDAVMVLGLVAGVYWLQQGKLARSGAVLAFGTMVKFIPVVAVPTVLIYLIKKKRPLGEIVTFLVAYGVACVVLLGPFLNGLIYVTQFQASRSGGGMNWEMAWNYPQLWPGDVYVPPISVAIGAFGTPTLIIVLLCAYWYLFKTTMSLNRMIVVTLLAFLIGSKLVNEQYALVLLPFVYIEAHRLGGIWRWFVRLLWIIPIAYTVMHVPIDHFLWLLYHTVLGDSVNVIALTQLTGFESAFIPWKQAKLDPISVVALGIAFFGVCIVAMLWPVRQPPTSRPRRRGLLLARRIHTAERLEVVEVGPVAHQG